MAMKSSAHKFGFEFKALLREFGQELVFVSEMSVGRRRADACGACELSKRNFRSVGRFEQVQCRLEESIFELAMMIGLGGFRFRAGCFLWQLRSFALRNVDNAHILSKHCQHYSMWF